MPRLCEPGEAEPGEGLDPTTLWPGDRRDQETTEQGGTTE